MLYHLSINELLGLPDEVLVKLILIEMVEWVGAVRHRLYRLAPTAVEQRVDCGHTPRRIRPWVRCDQDEHLHKLRGERLGELAQLVRARDGRYVPIHRHEVLSLRLCLRARTLGFCGFLVCRRQTILKLALSVRFALSDPCRLHRLVVCRPFGPCHLGHNNHTA
jgi:hypothetical protein